MRQFEWDDEKAETNWRKHRVRFEEAQLVFSDPCHITRKDQRFDYGEDRWWTIGMVEKRRVLLFVAHTTEGNGIETIRIISARKAHRGEERLYGDPKVY